MRAMTLDEAYEVIEKSSEGVRYPFSLVKEAHRIIDESRKQEEKKPSIEGFVFSETQLPLF